MDFAAKATDNVAWLAGCLMHLADGKTFLVDYIVQSVGCATLSVDFSGQAIESIYEAINSTSESIDGLTGPVGSTA
jgi:hypothetical protein